MESGGMSLRTTEPAPNDVHHDMNFLPNAQDQIGILFLTGEIANVCDGSCDPD